jgi:hypothetical protein
MALAASRVLVAIGEDHPLFTMSKIFVVHSDKIIVHKFVCAQLPVPVRFYSQTRLHNCAGER